MTTTRTITHGLSIASFAILGAITIGAVPADAQSACKGLDRAPCEATPSCSWQAERKAGETNPRTNQPFKRDTKAFCRVGAKKAATPTK